MSGVDELRQVREAIVSCPKEGTREQNLQLRLAAARRMLRYVAANIGSHQPNRSSMLGNLGPFWQHRLPLGKVMGPICEVRSHLGNTVKRGYCSRGAIETKSALPSLHLRGPPSRPEAPFRNSSNLAFGLKAACPFNAGMLTQADLDDLGVASPARLLVSCAQIARRILNPKIRQNLRF